MFFFSGFSDSTGTGAGTPAMAFKDSIKDVFSIIKIY
jgi:hypothetical protein